MTSGVLKLKEMKIMFEFTITIFFGSSFVIYFYLYSDDKNICDNIPWERENSKSIGLVGPMGKRGFFPTFTVHIGLVGMGVALPSCYDPFGWLMVLHLLLGPSALIVCGTLATFGMMT